MIHQLAAVLSIIAALMLAGIGTVVLIRHDSADVPAIAHGRVLRTRRAVLGIAIAIAIVISALPAVIYADHADRFEMLYGPLGYPLQAATQLLVVAIIIIGTTILFRERARRNVVKR